MVSAVCLRWVPGPNGTEGRSLLSLPPSTAASQMYAPELELEWYVSASIVTSHDHILTIQAKKPTSSNKPHGLV